MSKSTVIPKLFFFGVSNPESVATAFSQCVSYSYSWKEIFDSRKNDGGILDCYSDEFLALCFNNLIQLVDAEPFSKAGATDVIVVLNPEEKIVDMSELWVTSCKRMWIRSLSDAQTLVSLNRKVDYFSTAMYSMSIFSKTDWKIVRSECPEISEFRKKAKAGIRKAGRQFKKRFMV
jgi:hypothetical protein